MAKLTANLIAMIVLAIALLGDCWPTRSSPLPPGPWVNEVDGSIMLRVPGGAFTMGHAELKGTSQGFDAPAHRVDVPAFSIGRYDVTNAQWRKFIRATGYRANGEWEVCARENGEQAPVVEVSWYDAMAYCKWAGLRLPTEAEWEKAARGTDERAFPWGNTWDATRCRNNVHSLQQPMESVLGPSPVGAYPSGASPYGCLDMIGNVRQWCSSKYKPYPYDASDGRETSTFTQEEVAAHNAMRIVRGGSFAVLIPLRAFDRFACPPNIQPHDLTNDEPAVDIGFRVASSR